MARVPTIAAAALTASAQVPDEDAPPALSSWQGLKATIIYQALRSQRGWLLLLLVLTLLSLTTSAAMIVTIKSVFDDAIVARTKSIDELVDALFFLAIVGFVIGVAVRQIGSRVIYQLEYDLRCWMYDRLQAVDPRSLDRLAAGQLVTRALTDLNFLEQLTAIVPVLLVGGVILTAIVSVMIAINPLMGTITLLAFPVNAIIVKRMARRLRGLSWLSLHRRAVVTTSIDESVRGIRVVKAFAAEPQARNEVADAAAKAYTVAIARIRLLARFGLPVKAIPLVINALLVYVGARLAVDGSFSIGSLVIYLGFAIFFTSLAAQIDEAVSSYQFARTGSSRIFELLAAPSPNRGGTAALPERPVHGLRLTGAAVNGATPIDLHIAPGGWAAVTGPPGSGSSAVGRMAIAAEPVACGSITLDGVAIDEVDPDELRVAARLVEAESFLFGRTVRENLCMGSPRAALTDDELLAALAAAGAREFVEQLPGGIDGSIGDRGLTLSGGQRQRLALARALVDPPRLLVLDDALSAVNPLFEIAILETARAHAPEMAMLLISRREGPLAAVDRVVTLPDPVVATVPAPAVPDAPSFERPSDPALAAIVDDLHLPDLRPAITEDEAIDDRRPPTLAAIVRPSRGSVLCAVLLLVVLSVVTLVPTVLFQFAVNGIREKDLAPATAVAIVLIPVALALTVVTYLLRIVVTRVNESVLYTLRRRVFQRLSRLGVDYYDRELPGRVAARVVYDLDRITEFINTGVFPLVSSLFLFATATVVLAIANPTVFAVVGPFVPVMVVATLVQAPLANRAYRAARERLGKVVERFQEDFSGRHVIAAFGGQDAARTSFAAMSWRLRQSRRRATSVANTYLALMELLAALATATLVLHAGRLAIDGNASVGSVVFLQLLLTQALAPITTLSVVLQSYLNARASFRELGQPFTVTPLPVESPSASPCPTLTGALALDHVTFRYPGTERDVLHDVSLRIEPGEVVAVVGPTGAGKSSIAKLLGRLYDPDVGTVLADGLDVRSIDLPSYRRHLGIVPQDGFCFRGTVASNISFGRPGASDDDVVAAVHGCGGIDLLSALPNGLASEVDEEGRNLSPVARQWIALARAWLVEPDVLVLDEATSSLPPGAEQRVVDSLRRLGRSAVLVTHRLAIAARADRVVLVEQGAITEQGSHEQLLALGGSYAALWAHALPDEAVGGGERVAVDSR